MLGFSSGNGTSFSKKLSLLLSSRIMVVLSCYDYYIITGMGAVITSNIIVVGLHPAPNVTLPFLNHAFTSHIGQKEIDSIHQHNEYRCCKDRGCYIHISKHLDNFTTCHRQAND